MPSGPGANDSEGVYKYGEADVQSLASDLLNLSPTTISTLIGLHRVRLSALELSGRYLEVANASSIANNTVTTIGGSGVAWTENADANAWHDPVTNPTRLIPKASPAANRRIRLKAAGAWGASSTGLRYVAIGLNGTFAGRRRAVTSAAVDGNGTAIVTDEMTVNMNTDYLEVQVFQTSGGALTLDMVVSIVDIGLA